MSEKALLTSSNNYFKPTILRLEQYLVHQKECGSHLVVNTMSKFAYYKNKIDVYGGTQLRPNIHVDDVADGINSVIKAKKKMWKTKFSIYRMIN